MTTPQALVLHAAPRVVVSVGGGTPSVVATAAGVDLGAVACGRAAFGGGGPERDAGALLGAAAAYPGVHPGKEILGRYIRNNSLRLASLAGADAPLTADKGGTGAASFAAGAVLGASGGGGVVALPGVSWDGASKALTASGAEAGGLPVIR
jgi:hypothetical protein